MSEISLRIQHYWMSADKWNKLQNVPKFTKISCLFLLQFVMPTQHNLSKLLTVWTISTRLDRAIKTPNENQIPTGFVETDQVPAVGNARRLQTSHMVWQQTLAMRTQWSTRAEPLFSSVQLQKLQAWGTARVQWREGREETLEDVEHMPIRNGTLLVQLLFKQRSVC